MQHNSAFELTKPSLLVIACGWLACLLVVAAPVSAQQHPGVKCIVDGDLQCRVQYSVEFGQGQVFFGSKAGVNLFQTKVVRQIELGQQPEQALVLKANHQLALTNQVQQQRCPVTGDLINNEHELLIAGVRVFFHDGAAKEKMQAAESTWHRAQQVFASEAFAKSYISRVEPPQQTPVVVADGSSKLPTQNDGSADSATTR